MSCADVCLDHDVDYGNDFYSAALVTARKSYKCGECGDAIPVGAKYERASGKSDGELWTAKTCALCHEIREAFVCGGFLFTQLWESIEEEMFPIWNTRGPIDCLAKLTTLEARNKCRDRYRDWLEEQS